MATLVTVTGVAEALVVYLFYWVVTEQTSAAGGRTVFFAEFYTWLHAGTLALLVFGANRVLDRVGLVAALATLPLALVAGTTIFLVHTVVLVMYVLRIVEAVIEESVYGLALERVLLGVDEQDAPVVRPMLQGLMSRAGRGVGAVLVIALELGLDLAMTGFALVYMGVLLLWMVAGFRVCRQDLGSGDETDTELLAAP
jgi:ATP/ADP translocase